MKHRLMWAPVALFFMSVSAAWSIRSGPQLVRLPVDTVPKVKLGETIGSDRSQTDRPAVTAPPGPPTAMLRFFCSGPLTI